ncbi:hypothetical protein J2R98_002225 [Alkalibacillus filiformis]|uniref:Flagellar operon protein TIGR03826 n=1 Tax=Alkalibacillus filiformis TaxID=200990 RepID=A0ABU0DVC6_9BACI|nr:hypothetical protein [Alkalibacillus filiformis]MDQ0352381.1 hypothetical protein [Alkalibacillus filiformis]
MLVRDFGICSHCGRMTYITYDLCRDCYNEEEETIQKIKTYLRTHPRANAMDISSGTGISIHKITRLIKNGMIV